MSQTLDFYEASRVVAYIPRQNSCLPCGHPFTWTEAPFTGTIEYCERAVGLEFYRPPHVPEDLRRHVDPLRIDSGTLVIRVDQEVPNPLKYVLDFASQSRCESWYENSTPQAYENEDLLDDMEVLGGVVLGALVRVANRFTDAHNGLLLTPPLSYVSSVYDFDPVTFVSVDGSAFHWGGSHLDWANHTSAWQMARSSGILNSRLPPNGLSKLQRSFHGDAPLSPYRPSISRAFEAYELGLFRECLLAVMTALEAYLFHSTVNALRGRVGRKRVKARWHELSFMDRFDTLLKQSHGKSLKHDAPGLEERLRTIYRHRNNTIHGGSRVDQALGQASISTMVDTLAFIDSMHVEPEFPELCARWSRRNGEVGELPF